MSDEAASEFHYMNMLEALAQDDGGRAVARKAHELSSAHAIGLLAIIARQLAQDHAEERGVPIEVIFEERRTRTTAYYVHRFEEWFKEQSEEGD